MFTSSFACTPSPASDAITSLAFVFEDVPEPVWKTSIGNWSSCSPAATASPAVAIRSATWGSSRPSSGLARAAAALIRPSQRTTGTGTGCPETGKLETALLVSTPQSSVEVSVAIVSSVHHFSNTEAIVAPSASAAAGRVAARVGEVERAPPAGPRAGVARAGLEPPHEVCVDPAGVRRPRLYRADEIPQAQRRRAARVLPGPGGQQRRRPDH